MLSAALVAGAFFAVSWFVFIDGLIVAGTEDLASAHFTFLNWIPGIFSTMSFVIINMTKPSELHSGAGSDAVDVGDSGDEHTKQRAMGFYFVGWLIGFSSVLGALVFCGVNYVGSSQSRTHAYPGVALVLQPLLMNFSALAMWCGKATPSNVDMHW